MCQDCRHVPLHARNQVLGFRLLINWITSLQELCQQKVSFFSFPWLPWVSEGSAQLSSFGFLSNFMLNFSPTFYSYNLCNQIKQPQCYELHEMSTNFGRRHGWTANSCSEDWIKHCCLGPARLSISLLQWQHFQASFWASVSECRSWGSGALTSSEGWNLAQSTQNQCIIILELPMDWVTGTQRASLKPYG